MGDLALKVRERHNDVGDGGDPAGARVDIANHVNSNSINFNHRFS